MKGFKKFLRIIVASLVGLLVMGVLFLPWIFVPFPYNYIGASLTFIISMIIGIYQGETLRKSLGDG